MRSAVKRPYASPRRRAQALATRRRLAASARRLFAERGYAATTIEAIAQAADLAVQTFYATYGSKRAVLFALLDEMDQAADMPGLLERLRQAEGDCPRQLAALVDFNVRLFGQSSDVLEVLRAAGAADPDIAAVARAGDDRRRAGQAPIVRGWARAGVLRAGLDEASAVDILWGLTSPELFQLFVVRQHWPPARYAGWLRHGLQRLLFT
ncbi:MAG: helix-turn-helix transcriptional regulator [Chloroflexi bacterium]|nr:helix-turn-helix transcriptional regulator [Chloroflexota bacterium]